MRRAAPTLRARELRGCAFALLVAGCTCAVPIEPAPADAGADAGPRGDGGCRGRACVDAQLPTDGGRQLATTGALRGPTIRRVPAGSALFDGAGVAHVVVAGDELRHFLRIDGSWQEQSPGVRAEVARAAVDRQGRPIAMFLDRDRPAASCCENLGFARLEDGVWRLEPVTVDQRRAPYDVVLEPPSLAAGPGDAVWAAYYTGVSFESHYEVASRAGPRVWSTHWLTRSFFPGNVGVALDAELAPWILWSETPTEIVARRPSSSEMERLPGSTAHAFEALSDRPGPRTLVMWGGRVPDVMQVYLLEETPSGFVASPPCELPRAHGPVSAAHLDDGRIAFGLWQELEDLGPRYPAFATFEPGGCAVTRVDEPIDDLAVLHVVGLEQLSDTNGIAFAASGSQRLLAALVPSDGVVAWYSSDAGATWERSILSSSRTVGLSPSIAIDPRTGATYIASLDLASARASLLADEGNGFVEQPAAPELRAYHFTAPGTTAALVDPATGELVVVQVESNDLAVARRAGGEWRTTYVPARVTGLLHPVRAAFDAAGRLVIFDGQRLATLDGEAWASEDPDGPFPSELARPSLQLFPDGSLLAAYLSDRGDPVVLERSAAGEWTVSTIEADNWVSPDAAALAAVRDATGTVHVVFTANDFGSSIVVLRYARRTGSGWEITEIDGLLAHERNPVLGIDLAVGPRNRLALAYHSPFFRRPILRVRRGARWDEVPLSTEGNDGWHPTLAIDLEGRAVVAWHHRGRGDLRVERVSLR